MPKKLNGQGWRYDAGTTEHGAIQENRNELIRHVAAIERLQQRQDQVFSQEVPCTEWGRRVEKRVQALEEEVEAGLSSLGEQVDRLDKIIRDILERPEVRGLGEAPDMGSMLDQEELLSSIDRHLEEAHAWRANACQAWDRQDKSTAEFDLRLAAAHADTARAMAALLSCVA